MYRLQYTDGRPVTIGDEIKDENGNTRRVAIQPNVWPHSWAPKGVDSWLYVDVNGVPAIACFPHGIGAEWIEIKP